jgi:3-oxoacyl-[acyl-carrier protein] reductase
VKLKDKKMILTGASCGLGRAIALEAAREGATVFFTYLKNTHAAQDLEAELNRITSAPHRGFKVSADDLRENTLLSKKIDEEFFGVDIIVNNAGFSDFLPLALMDEKDWDKMNTVNLKGVYATTKAFLPSLIRKRHGSILNIGSLAGARMLAAPVHYCATKAGVIGFTEGLAKEIGRYNIRVNCLAPGILEGGVAQNIPQNKIEDYLKQTALKRLGTFFETARAAIFMVSDDNSYMNGHTILLDGGL